jgi:hypothetical protein
MGKRGQQSLFVHGFFLLLAAKAEVFVPFNVLVYLWPEV